MNVFLPIATYYFALGGTMNMYNYDDYSKKARIFDESDFVQDEYENTTYYEYYLLQEDRLPYPNMRLPIDLLLRVKSNMIPQTIDYFVPRTVHNDPLHDAVALVMNVGHTTGSHRLRETAVPRSGWQQSVPKTATHYADKLLFGGSCFAIVEVKSSVGGDVQIIRRIFTEAMGESKLFQEKHLRGFQELWKYAMRAAEESPDVRGHVYVSDFSVQCTNIELPVAVRHSFEKFLEYLPNISIPHSVFPKVVEGRFKPLHHLDERYPPVDKNRQSEAYLTSLDRKIDDLKKVVMKGYRIPRTEESKIAKGAFWKKVEGLRATLNRLISGEMSIYKDIDVESFDRVFKQYEAGLDEGDKDYYSAWKKLLENIEMSCGNKFHKPTTGLLIASDDEVANIRSVREGGLKACKKYCRKEDRCRAIAYDETNPKMCRIYSVSTNTAMIYAQEESHSTKIYDRQCDKM